ncbi:MAG: hypothetical protein RXS42_08435 [Nitrososphaeria archaeon]
MNIRILTIASAASPPASPSAPMSAAVTGSPSATGRPGSLSARYVRATSAATRRSAASAAAMRERRVGGLTCARGGAP